MVKRWVEVVYVESGSDVGEMWWHEGEYNKGEFSCCKYADTLLIHILSIVLITSTEPSSHSLGSSAIHSSLIMTPHGHCVCFAPEDIDAF